VPFTVSHVAAVLPLRSGRTAVEALPAAPLVIGSMSPDLPTVLGLGQWRAATHQLVSAVTLDVALTGVLALAWVALVRPVVAHVVPRLAARWRPPPRRRHAALWWYLAAATGSLTHVVWDAFTHVDEGIGSWVPAVHGDNRLFLALQLVSSVVGLVVLAWWCRRWWQRTAPAEEAPAARRRPLLLGAGAVAVAAVAAGGWRYLEVWGAPPDPTRPAVTVGAGAFGVLDGLLGAGLCVAAVYRLVLWRRGRADGGAPAAAVREPERTRTR
jgi:hypothetical protein